MRIAVYGAGVIGSYLAHTLIQADHDVTMIARGKRYEELQTKGIEIRHYFQRKETVDPVKVIYNLEKTDIYDLIFVVMQYGQFQSVLPILAENNSENIVLMGNNASAADMRDFICTNSKTRKKVAFGFQTSGGMRTETGKVLSIHGGGNVLIGELEAKKAVYPLVQKALGKNHKVRYQEEMDAWLKTHYVYIAAMNATHYIYEDNLKKLSKDKQALKDMAAAIGEGFDVLEKLGYSITPAIQGKMIRKYKRATYCFNKFYYKLPLNRIVKGSYAEIYALF